MMLIPYDPDKYVTTTHSTICGYHRDNPGKAWPGCTCSTSIGQRKATPNEYLLARRKRLEDRRKDLCAELANIEAELSA